MSSYRITHIDEQHCKRVLHVRATCRDDAIALAMRAYGEAWAVAAIRL